jgi:DUF1680 family protein
VKSPIIQSGNRVRIRKSTVVKSFTSVRVAVVVSAVLTLSLCLHGAAAELDPASLRGPAKMPDAAEVLSPADVHIDGWLGERLTANARNRLLTLDLEPLLAGFRTKPGSHPWIGEHIGKWLHAATLAWANTGDPRLRKKLDDAVTELLKTQESDGYLGTYLPDKRLGLEDTRNADWDVWSFKYNLIGLLTYHQYTGDPAALEACRRMADLLVATFPEKRSILAAGEHMGMAATSVLEPMVLLYRFTGDARYLEFARYLVKSWDEPRGPKIIATLLSTGQVKVNKSVNLKAYEYLSNLVGLCELVRVTGDRDALQAVQNAWQDVVTRRLYLTGGASQGEHFRDGDHYLPNHDSAHVSETCVTVTWLQFNMQLLRLTGEAKFSQELERTLYNQLAAAQRPDGSQWCYFTSLDGKKPYGYYPGITCCYSSGPRGIALAPLTAYLKTSVDDVDALAVNTFETSRATVDLSGARVTVEQESRFPHRGESALTFKLAQPARFALQVGPSAWARPVRLSVNGQETETTERHGWITLAARQWKDGDRVELRFNLGASVVMGTHGNAGRAALTWGPFVLAYDASKNAGMPVPLALGFSDFATPPFTLQPGSDLVFGAGVRSAQQPQSTQARFVTFADAGSDGGAYRVWLTAPGVELPEIGLLVDGQESRSRRGNWTGSINDGDKTSLVVTWRGRAEEDWYAVTLTHPVTIARVAFTHGMDFDSGGWFDASAGKPRIQVQRTPGGPWETVAELAAYPATTAKDKAGLKPFQNFTQRLAEPVNVVAVRVLGRPASGNYPNQAFSSCAELEAFAD